jgi:hypothetical protein
MAQLDVTKEFIFVMHESATVSPTVREEAVQEGVRVLFLRQVTDAYVNNQLDRDQALQLLGPEELSAVECEWQSDDQDTVWAMGTA